MRTFSDIIRNHRKTNIIKDTLRSPYFTFPVVLFMLYNMVIAFTSIEEIQLFNERSKTILLRKRLLNQPQKAADISQPNHQFPHEMTTGKRAQKFVGRNGSSLRSKERPKNDVRKRSLREGNLLQPIRSTTQIWVVTRHQYGISAVISQTSFPGGTSGGVVNPNAYVFQTFRACLHGGGGPRVGEVTCLGGVKKISLLYKQSYNPAIPGCTFSRLLNGR